MGVIKFINQLMVLGGHYLVAMVLVQPLVSHYGDESHFFRYWKDSETPRLAKFKAIHK